MYCNNPKLVYEAIIITSPTVIKIVLPTRDINFPVIFDISTNPKGDVKLTSPKIGRAHV